MPCAVVREENSVRFQGKKILCIIDGTEQILVPSDILPEEDCYSGKKKLHMFSVMLAVSVIYTFALSHFQGQEMISPFINIVKTRFTFTLITTARGEWVPVPSYMRALNRFILVTIKLLDHLPSDLQLEPLAYPINNRGVKL